MPHSSPGAAARYPDLYPPFIWASFLIAILGGFGLAGHLSYVFAYGVSSGPSLLALIQAHGHLQIFGWMGMLLIGVSLYVLPRMTSNPSGSRNQIVWIFRFAVVGVLLRTLAPVAEGYLPLEQRLFCGALTFTGAVFQALAVGAYLHFVVSGVRLAKIDRSDVLRLLPFLLSMAIGWLVFVGSDLIITAAALVSAGLISPLWTAFQIEAFLRLVLVMGILGFGVKMLPVFLGLRAPLWPVRDIGWMLAASTLGLLFCRFIGLLQPDLFWPETVAAWASMFLSVTMLWYIWELDALLFRVRPERISLKVFRSDAATHRGRFGDRGEYGRFELFAIAGFMWLALVACLEIANSLAFLVGSREVVSPQVIRHILLLGFAAHLVFGVGHRLLPNLLHRKLINPRLTLVAFCLLFASALTRTVPLTLGEYEIRLPREIFAMSGTLGLSAMLVFAVNLLGTKRT